MRRPALIALLPALMLLAACGATRTVRATAPQPVPLEARAVVATQRVVQVAGTVGAASLAAPVAAEEDPHAPGAADYIAVVPENAIWWPWKIVGGTVKGLFDGLAAGFGPDQLPILGVLFSPVNAALGTATGLVTGTLSQPGWIGPRDNFGKTIGLPIERPTPIWWLPN